MRCIRSHCQDRLFTVVLSSIYVQEWTPSRHHRKSLDMFRFQCVGRRHCERCVCFHSFMYWTCVTWHKIKERTTPNRRTGYETRQSNEQDVVYLSRKTGSSSVSSPQPPGCWLLLCSVRLLRRTTTTCFPEWKQHKNQEEEFTFQRVVVLPIIVWWERPVSMVRVALYSAATATTTATHSTATNCCE